MTIWFSSDQHLGHRGIIERCNRPFRNVKEMDTTIIKNWNDRVQKKDKVYLLGDFTLKGQIEARGYFSQLNGHIRILENPWHHDKQWLKAFFVPLSASGVGIVKLQSIVVLEFEEYGDKNHPKPVVLCHYPLATWEKKPYGAWHLHGHSHGNYHYPPGNLAIDVGVDCTDFAPISLEEVAERMKAIVWDVSPDLDSVEDVIDE